MKSAGGARSLFWPVAGAFLLAAVVGTLLQGLVVLAVVQPMERREARARAELLVSAVATAYAAQPVAPRGAALDSLLRVQRDANPVRPSVLFVRYDDGTIVTSPPEFATMLARQLRDSTGGARGPRDDGPPGRSELIARHALEHGGVRVGEVRVMRRQPRGPSPEANPFGLLLYIPIALLASGVAGFVLVRMLVKRLGALEELATRVAGGDLSVRVGDPGGDEIARVAAQLDRMTERLAASRTELESHDRQRRQLFADITHELATPLTSIRVAAETLIEGKVAATDEDRTRWLKGVLEESRRLDRMIRDLFELARLEAGAAPLQRERLDLAALARNTLERFAPRYAQAGLALEWTGDPGEAWIEADGLRVEQVLDNLLVNALRYVPEQGRVRVALVRAGARWRLTVSDDGPGLPADELPHVFERFYRGAGARGGEGAREAGGSGLGLAIVREIVERHGGAVRAKAAEPRGLAIEVELPGV